MPGSDSDVKRRVLGTVLGAAVVALGLWHYAGFMLLPPLQAAVIGGHSACVLQAFGGPLTGNDFAHIYTGSWALWHGANPYDPEILLQLGRSLTGRDVLPYVYLPFTGLVMGPLTALSYPNAFLAWFLANHAMLWLAILAAFAGLGLRWTWRNAAFAGLAVCLSFPLYRTLSAGQLNVALALAYALFWMALTRRREDAAGLIGAFAALFKLSPGILFLYLLWTRRWRGAAWMAGGAALLLGASIAWAGLGVHGAFLPVLRDMGYGRSAWAQFGHHFYCDEANQSFNSLFHHLFAVNPVGKAPLLNWGPAAANGLTWAVSLSLLGLTLVWTRPRGERTDGRPDPLGYSLFIVLSLFLPGLCWDHYFIQLLLPILAMFQALERRPSLSLGALFLVSLLVVSLPFNFWDERWKSGFGLLMLSWKLWGALGLFAANALLLDAERRRPDAEG